MKYWSVFYMISLLLSAHNAQSSAHAQQHLAKLNAKAVQLKAYIDSVFLNVLMRKEECSRIKLSMQELRMRQEECCRINLSIQELNERNLTFQAMNADLEQKMQESIKK
jgi:hypothetical protein